MEKYKVSDFYLISHHLCPYVQRAAIVLAEKDIPHKRSYIDLANKPDWFRQLFPLGRVPVLQTKGAILFESQVIAEYLDEITPGSLHPADPLEKAHPRSWIEFGSETLNVIASFYNAPVAQLFEEKRNALYQNLRRIDREIAGPYFGGNAFRMIDGVWGTIFRYLDAFDRISDFGFMTDLAAIPHWRDSLAQRPTIVQAPPPGYSERIATFLRQRNSHLSGLMA